MDSFNITVEDIKSALRKTKIFRIVEKPQKELTVTSIHVKIVHSDGGSRHLAKLIYIANQTGIKVNVNSDANTIETDPRNLYYSINISYLSKPEEFIQQIGEAKWL